MQQLGFGARLTSIFVVAVTACSSSDSTLLAGASGESRGNDSAISPAVMVAVATRSPEGSNFYVGAYPELPAEVDLATMLETPSGQNAAAFNGFIYVWSPETGVYTRYSVDEQLRLSQSGAVSFVNEGGTGNVMTHFISPERAYSMTRDNLRIVVWNPTEMTVIGGIDTSAAIDPRYTEFDYGEPVLFGDYVAWPILWYSYDDFDFKPALEVILASASSEEPAFAVSDLRCGGGWSLFSDDEGDLHAPCGLREQPYRARDHALRHGCQGQRQQRRDQQHRPGDLQEALRALLHVEGGEGHAQGAGDLTGSADGVGQVQLLAAKAVGQRRCGQGLGQVGAGAA